MNLFEQYGIKEVADVTLYAISLDKYDNEVYIPVIYFDTLKVSTVEQSAEQVSARGGLGNPELITWDFGKEITVNLQDALYTPASQSLVWGGRFNLGKIKIFGAWRSCKRDEGNPNIEVSDDDPLRYNVLNLENLSGQRIEKGKALIQYEDGKSADYFGDGPYYMHDFIRKNEPYGFEKLADCAELIVDNFSDFKIEVVEETNRIRYTWEDATLKLVVLNSSQLVGQRTIDLCYEEDMDQSNGILFFDTNIVYPDPTPFVHSLDFFETLYKDSYFPSEYQEKTMNGFTRKIGTFYLVQDRNYYNFSKENIIYPIDYGIKNATKIDRMEKVIASRDFVINVETNLQQYNYSQLSEYSNTNLKFYLDPFTMKPYQQNCTEFKSASGFTITGSLALIKRGSVYYKWTRDINAEKSLGKQILVDAKHYPGYFKLVGETYSRGREDGIDERLQFEIPLCKMAANTTLQLEAEGEPTVYDFSLKVMKPKCGPMMKLTQYKVKKDIYTALNGGKYCSNSTSVVPQEKVIEYNNCCPSPDIIERLFPTGDKSLTDYGMIDVNQEDLIPFVKNRIKIIDTLVDIGIINVEQDIIPARYNVDKPMDEAYFSTAIRYWLAKPHDKPVKELEEIIIVSPPGDTVYTVPNDFAHPYDNDQGGQAAPYLMIPESQEQAAEWEETYGENSEERRRLLIVKLVYSDRTEEYLTQETIEDYDITFDTGSGN